MNDETDYTTFDNVRDLLRARDQFAMAALAGLLASPEGGGYKVEEKAFRIADRMLTERARSFKSELEKAAP